MKLSPADPTLRDIHLLLRGGAAAGLTDGELLDRFAATGDEASFEVLVHRLGPMVLGVCRRTLRDRHDAEDAFQATFLVLARRARAIDPPARVGPWLHGVALRVAMRARGTRARRRLREAIAASPPERPTESRSERDDLIPLLDGELGRLPEKYRAPIVLCHLEGKPYKEAARQLGLREGTLSGRLTRGRALLASRLTRRGVTLSAGSIAGLLAAETSASVPATLAASAAGVACGLHGGTPTAIAAGVAALAGGTLRTMLMTRIRVAALAMATVGMVGVGVASGGRDDPEKTKPGDVAPTTTGASGGPVSEDGPYGTLVVNGPVRVENVGALRRVEAYKIGHDLFVNVAPPGSGRVLLERVSNGAATAPQTKPAAKEATPTARGRISGALDEMRSDSPDVFVTAPDRKPADPDEAALLYSLLVEERNTGSDVAFSRRTYLGILGRVPTEAEVKAYVEDPAPDKAETLILRLIDDPAAVDVLRHSLRLRGQAQAARLRRERERQPHQVQARARTAPGRTEVAKPIVFSIAGATLDRVDIDRGNLIDFHLGNGDDRLGYGRGGDLRHGDVVMPPATHLLAIPVGIDAPITVESGRNTTITGKGEAGLKALLPGMTLDLKVSAEGGYLLIITEIKARPKVARVADPRDTWSSDVQTGAVGSFPFDAFKVRANDRPVSPDAPPRRQ